MKHIQLFYLILLFGFTACSQQIPTQDAILLDISNSQDFLKEFPVSCELSFDGGMNENIPGTITRIQLTNDILYILDPYKAKAFFAFDRNGKKLFEYSKIGQGEDEYLFLRDFYCDDNYIYLLDSDSHKILVLDKAGVYQTKLDTPAHIAHFLTLTPFKSKDIEFLFDMYGSEKAMLLKSNGTEITDTLMMTPEGLDAYLYLPLYVFQKSVVTDSDILYMPSYSSVIYKISDSGDVKTYLNLDFNGLLPDKEFFKSLKGLKYMEKERRIMEYAHDFGFLCSNGTILVSFFYDDILYLNFINESDKKKQVKTYRLSPTYYPIMYNDDKLYFMSSEKDNITVVDVSNLNNDQ